MKRDLLPARDVASMTPYFPRCGRPPGSVGCAHASSKRSAFLTVLPLRRPSGSVLTHRFRGLLRGRRPTWPYPQPPQPSKPLGIAR